MVFVELGHEATVRPHDRPFRPDRGERIVRRHLTGSDKVGDHHRRTPADAHGTVDLFYYFYAHRECVLVSQRNTFL